MAFKADPDVVLSRAKAVASDRLAGMKTSAADVYLRLIGTLEMEPKSVSHIVKLSGKTTFKVSVSKNRVAIDLPAMSKSMLSKVEKAIVDALKEEGALP